jgi:hypothetical protein
MKVNVFQLINLLYYKVEMMKNHPELIIGIKRYFNKLKLFIIYIDLLKNIEKME